MIAPMLASPMSKADISDWNDWVMEEKYDGHRLVVAVAADGGVKAFTRERRRSNGSKTQATRELPAHLTRELAHLRGLTLDGELQAILPDGHLGTSTDVTRVDLQSTLRFVVFDVLMTQSGSAMMLPYIQRRAILEGLRRLEHVVIADARECVDADTVATYCHEVWSQGGEGLILKRKSARYLPGRRSPDFVKIKKLFTAICTVVGFEATRGTVMNRGPFATVILEDEQGKRTSVKTKDDYELASFNKQAENIEGTLDHVLRTHPAIGRKLRIEYQDIAADGGYRHPRWDRWEDE